MCGGTSYTSNFNTNEGTAIFKLLSMQMLGYIAVLANPYTQIYSVVTDFNPFNF